MADDTSKQLIALQAAQVAALGRIAAALEAIALTKAPAPNFIRPLADYPAFEFESIGARVTGRDQHGVTAVEWAGYHWTRRAPSNKFGSAIWFSRPAGKDEAGNVRYVRLITFREPTEPEPLPAKVAAQVTPAGGASPIGTQLSPSKPAGNGDAGGGKAASWPAQIIKDILAERLAQNSYNAVAMLNKSKVVTPASDPDTVLVWARAYRVARDEGSTSDAAAAQADGRG